jgi:hypothetical protein
MAHNKPPSNPYRAFGQDTQRLRSSMLLIEKYPELEALVEALHAIDNGGDKAPLIELLKSTGSLRDALLADLLDRHDLAKKKGRGRPKRPDYVMPDDDLRLSQANAAVDDLVSPDCCLDEALDHAAEKYGTTKKKLIDFRTGRRRSLR